MKSSIFFKIFSSFLLISIIPFLIGLYAIFNFTIIEKKIELSQILKTQLIAKKDALLNKIKDEERDITEILKIYKLNGNISDALKFLIFKHKTLREILIFNENGKFITGQSFLRFIKPSAKFYIPDKKYSILFTDNDYLLIIKSKFYNKIIISKLSFRKILNEILFQHINKLYKYFIIDNKGNFIYHTDYSYVLENKKFTNFQKNKILEASFINPIYNKREYFFCYIIQLKNFGLNFGIAINKKEALFEIYSFLYKGIFLILLIFILSLITCYYLAKKITTPIKNLENLTKEIRKGNYNIKFPQKKPNDEIGEFYSNFELMTNTITKLIQENENKIKKLNLLYNTIDDSIYIINSNYEIVLINRNELEYLNKSLSEVIGEKCYKVLGKKDSICNNCPIEKIKKDKHPVFYNNINIVDEGFRPSCKRKFVNIKFYPFGEDEFLVFIQDLTQIYNVLNEIKFEREKLFVTLHAIGDGVIVVDKNKKVILINKSAKNIFGIKNNILGENVEKFFPELSEYINNVFINKAQLNINETKIFRDDKFLIIEDSIAPIFIGDSLEGVVIVLRDITEKKKYEEEILKKEKLEAVGMLAAGIAHDFNNILTAAIGNISLCELYIDNREKLYDKLKSTENSLYKAKSLTEKLLTFSKGGYLIKEKNDIKKIIKESVDFILSGKDIKVKYNFDENLWSVNVDSSQITQVFHNLTLNSLDAIKNNGEIEITVKNKIIDKYSELPLKEGHYIEIIFKDNGKGIPQEIINKIFDPFFTTKETGSGLGLATVYNIIKKHDGFIKVNSVYGKGTIFFIYLPAEIVESDNIKKEKIRESKKEKKFNILLMDDNDELREVVTELLQLLGHNVYTATKGEEAIEIYKQNNIDYVILDLTIPGGMGGKETLKQLKKIDKNVKAVVSSGYTDDDVMANYKKYGFIAKIEKPYTLEKLKELLKELETQRMGFEPTFND